MLWICINPSIADGIEDDRTVERIIHFTKNGPDGEVFGSVIVANLYAFAAPNLVRLGSHIRDRNRDIAEDKVNDAHVARLADAAARTVVAWGSNPLTTRPSAAGRLGRSVEVRKQLPDRVWCLGLTEATRRPRHPGERGHVPRDQPLVEFDG